MPSAIRAAVQTKFKQAFVDGGVVQTVLEKITPTRGIDLQPEIRELIDFLEANESEFEHQCQYLTTKLNGQDVREIRNIFFATKQMIRMCKEYGQFRG